MDALHIASAIEANADLFLTTDKAIIRKMSSNPQMRVMDPIDFVREFDEDIHLAILDMGMPIMGASEAFPLLIEARTDVRVIVTSGYELDASAQGVLDAGASAFLQKPFHIHDLATEIRKALES